MTEKIANIKNKTLNVVKSALMHVLGWLLACGIVDFGLSILSTVLSIISSVTRSTTALQIGPQTKALFMVVIGTVVFIGYVICEFIESKNGN